MNDESNGPVTGVIQRYYVLSRGGAEGRRRFMRLCDSLNLFGTIRSQFWTGYRLESWRDGTSLGSLRIAEGSAAAGRILLNVYRLVEGGDDGQCHVSVVLDTSFGESGLKGFFLAHGLSTFVVPPVEIKRVDDGRFLPRWWTDLVSIQADIGAILGSISPPRGLLPAVGTAMGPSWSSQI